MIFAMGALLALQGYWILNAVEVKKDQFDRNVRTALMQTAKKLEQAEVLYVARQKLTNSNQHKLENISSEYLKINDTLLRKKIQQHDIVLNSIYNENFFKEYEKKIKHISSRIPMNTIKGSEYINEQLQKENDNLKKFISSNDSLEAKYAAVQALNNWLDSGGIKQPEQKYLPRIDTHSHKVNLEVVKGIIHDLMLGERSIADRMGHTMLDTLLKSELANMGINIPFKYAVEDKGKIALESNSEYDFEDGYKIRLFPGDSYNNNQFLHVDFPDKEDVIYDNLIWLLAISVLLVILVGGIFYYSANSLISERKLAKVKNDFINNMTHELKTPVSSISLALEYLQDKEIHKTEEKSSKYLRIIRDENERLNQQITKVLQAARLEEKQIKLAQEKVNIVEILELSIETLDVQLKNGKTRVSFTDKTSNPITLGDSQHLGNVFQNLLDNAIKYSNEYLHLEIKVFNLDEDIIQVDIKDDGIGIAPEEKEHIFDKFYRVSTGNLHDVKGFGLGLNYVKNMIEQHQGDIFVKSVLNQGSTFSVQLKTFKK